MPLGYEEKNALQQALTAAKNANSLAQWLRQQHEASAQRERHLMAQVAQLEAHASSLSNRLAALEERLGAS
jgi:hypothetical protein